MPEKSERPFLRALVACAVAVPVLAGAAGCGHHSKASSSSAPAGASVPSRPLTAEQLRRALLSQAELPGAVFEPASPGDVPPMPASHVDKAACAPLVEQLGTGPHRVHVRAQAVQTVHDGRTEVRVDDGTETLAGYAPGGADATLKALRAALGSCHSVVLKNPSGDVPLHISKAPAPPTGDDAIAYFVTRPGDDRPASLMTVVRVGQVTASFLIFGMGADDPYLPPDVPAAQTAKLRAAGA